VSFSVIPWVLLLIPVGIAYCYKLVKKFSASRVQMAKLIHTTKSPIISLIGEAI